MFNQGSTYIIFNPPLNKSNSLGLKLQSLIPVIAGNCSAPVNLALGLEAMQAIHHRWPPNATSRLFLRGHRDPPTYCCACVPIE